MALSNAEKQRQYRMRCKVTKTPEELEEIRRKNRERVRRYRERKRQRLGGVSNYGDDMDSEYGGYKAMHIFGQSATPDYTQYPRFAQKHGEYLPTPSASPFMDAAKLASGPVQQFYGATVHHGHATPPLGDDVAYINSPELKYEEELKLFRDNGSNRFKRQKLVEDSDSDLSDLESQAAQALLDISNSTWSSPKKIRKQAKKPKLPPLAAPVAIKTNMPLFSAGSLESSATSGKHTAATSLSDQSINGKYGSVEIAEDLNIPPPPPPSTNKYRLAHVAKSFEPLLTITNLTPNVPVNSPIGGVVPESFDATRRVLEAVSLKVECFILQKEATINGQQRPRRGSWTSGMITPARDKVDTEKRLDELGIESRIHEPCSTPTVATKRSFPVLENSQSSFATPPRSPKKQELVNNPMLLSSIVNSSPVKVEHGH